MSGLVLWVNIDVDRVSRSIPLLFHQSFIDPVVAGFFVCTARASLSPSSLRKASIDIRALVTACNALSPGHPLEADTSEWLRTLPDLLSRGRTAGSAAVVAAAWNFLLHLAEAGHVEVSVLKAFLGVAGSRASERRVGRPRFLSHIVPNVVVGRARVLALPRPASIRGSNVPFRARPRVSFPEHLIFRFFVDGLRRDGASQGRLERRDAAGLVADYNVMAVLYFLMLAFGGLRASEPLHLYVGDVAFDFERGGGALVSLWHPETGPAPARPGARRKTRTQYLEAEFGLRPRTTATGSARVGWKNLLLEETVPDLGIRTRIFWLIPEIGVLFWRLHEVYIHSVRPAAPACPYYFVSRSNNSFGTPWTLGAAEAAFQRALGKLGVEPDDTRGLCMHGFRHRAKTYLDQAGVPAKDKQLFLHHQSIGSQAGYGRLGPAEMFDLLSALSGSRDDASQIVDPPRPGSGLAGIGLEIARYILEGYDALDR